MKKNNFIYLFSLIWLLSSCNVNAEFEAITNIPEQNWKSDSSISFNFEITENSTYDIFYLVKNKTTYPYYNLYFKTDFRDQNSLISNKLQEVILFNKKTGKPYGKGLGGIMEHQFLAFPKQKLKKGKHLITLKQYMRINELKGVIAVGIKVVKAE